MAELVHERAITLTDGEGRMFDRARVYAEPQRGTTWAGWIEFVPRDGGASVRGRRETTQSNIEGVAYWATGLELLYFEGALARALRIPGAPEVPGPDDAEAEGAVEGAPGAVPLRLETVDPVAPLRLMATRTLVPGQRRWIKEGGVLVYVRTVRPPSAETPGIFEFTAQFGSENAAALMANTLWNDLHGQGVRLVIDGEEVALTNADIKDALLAASVA
jgi:hypothetical protein